MVNEVQIEKKEKPPSRFLSLRISALVEILGFFIVLFLIALFFGLNFNYLKTTPHPFWIVVVLISTQYGTSEGLIAALLSSVILFLAGPIPERTIIQEPYIYLFSLMRLPLMWFVTAVILGELRMKQIREMDILKDQVEESNRREAQIAASYESLKRIKERLEIHITSEIQTTLGIINAAKHLEEEGKEGILKSAVELTKAIIAPEKFSIFFLHEGGLKLQLSDGWEASDSYSTSFDSTKALYYEVVEKKRSISFYNGNLPSIGKEGIAAVPIITSENHVLGMIKIEQIPFLRLRTETLESLNLVGQWIGNAYENYLKREEK